MEQEDDRAVLITGTLPDTVCVCRYGYVHRKEKGWKATLLTTNNGRLQGGGRVCKNIYTFLHCFDVIQECANVTFHFQKMSCVLQKDCKDNRKP